LDNLKKLTTAAGIFPFAKPGAKAMTVQAYAVQCTTSVFTEIENAS
jgi:hypothetical protein